MTIYQRLSNVACWTFIKWLFLQLKFNIDQTLSFNSFLMVISRQTVNNFATLIINRISVVFLSTKIQRYINVSCQTRICRLHRKNKLTFTQRWKYKRCLTLKHQFLPDVCQTLVFQQCFTLVINKTLIKRWFQGM